MTEWNFRNSSFERGLCTGSNRPLALLFDKYTIWIEATWIKKSQTKSLVINFWVKKKWVFWKEISQIWKKGRAKWRKFCEDSEGLHLFFVIIILINFYKHFYSIDVSYIRSAANPADAPSRSTALNASDSCAYASYVYFNINAQTAQQDKTLKGYPMLPFRSRKILIQRIKFSIFNYQLKFFSFYLWKKIEIFVFFWKSKRERGWLWVEIER